MQDGKDSFPVFYVNFWSTLAHTVAKLTATRSHRMWIVDAPSPGSSIPPSPGVQHHAPPFSPPGPAHGGHHERKHSTGRSFSGSEGLPGSAVSATALPGANMSGRLSGVVSLTDVLNLLARASGLSPADPADARRRRRRTSSSSSTKPSVEGVNVRASSEFIRSSGELRRSGSTSSDRRR